MDKCSCIIVEFAIIFPIHRLQFLGFIFEFFCFQLTVLESSIVLKKKMSYADIFTPTDHKQHAMRYGVVSSNQSK